MLTLLPTLALAQAIEAWVQPYNGPENGNDGATAIALDVSGNVFVTGISEGTPCPEGLPLKCVTLAYSSAGVPLWTNRWPGSVSGGAVARAMALDASGNVFVTGRSADWYPDFVTIAYSSAGTPLWTKRYNGPANGYDQACAIAVDTSGNVYVTGGSSGSTSSNDLTTIKYVVPPIITRQPLSCTNAVGSTARLSVEVAGSAPFSYQWHKGETDLVDGSNISGVTSPNLVITDVQLADAGGAEHRFYRAISP